jgi:hypothetical protein
MEVSRGQAHTLEAIAAAILLLGGVVFALQSSVVTPLTASTASQHIENQQGEVAEGLLVAAADNGTLKDVVLYYGNSTSCRGGQFHNTSCPTGVGRPYANGGPPLSLGDSLNRTFLDRGIAYNVRLHYTNENGGTDTIRMVYVGRPSDNAVTASRTVTLYDDDRLLHPNGSRSSTTVGEADVTSCTSAGVSECREFFAPDAAPGDPLYNVVEIEVVIWRM